jgi:hypothetical protein
VGKIWPLLLWGCLRGFSVLLCAGEADLHHQQQTECASAASFRNLARLHIKNSRSVYTLISTSTADPQAPDKFRKAMSSATKGTTPSVPTEEVGSTVGPTSTVPTYPHVGRTA